jgi:hypothetical protein
MNVWCFLCILFFAICGGIFAEKMWNFICRKQFGAMDLRNWAFFAQTEISFVWEIGNMETPLSQIFFGIADKFRDIYNFAFGWAKEKVHPFYSPFRTCKVLSKGWISVLFHSQPCQKCKKHYTTKLCGGINAEEKTKLQHWNILVYCFRVRSPWHWIQLWVCGGSCLRSDHGPLWSYGASSYK